MPHLGDFAPTGSGNCQPLRGRCQYPAAAIHFAMVTVMGDLVVVTGGTGTLGKLVVSRLRDQGREVRVIARHARPLQRGVEYAAADLRTPASFESLLPKDATVLHLAGDSHHDEETTKNVATVAARSGVRHLLYISVTETNKIPIDYYRGKAAGEHWIADCGAPWTTLRAAQFHNLIAKAFAGLTKSPLVPVPRRLRLQPVEADAVADRLVELASGQPIGMVKPLAGPQVLTASEMVRDYLDSTGKSRVTFPLTLPGGVGRCFASGANLTLDADTAGCTWHEFLSGR